MVYFITDNHTTVFGQTLRECGFKIQQLAKKSDPSLAGYPIDMVLKMCADRGYKAGKIDFQVATFNLTS